MFPTLYLPARRVLRWPGLAAASVIALGVVLRFWDLGGGLLSYDESFTALIVQRSLPDLLAATAGDVHPPLGYVLLWAWVRLAGAVTPWTLRLPGAVLSVVALWQAHRLARRLSLPPTARLAALALLAASPFQLHYAQDARMYALLQVAVLGALLAGLDRRYYLMGAWLTIAVWTHNYGLFYLAVIGAVVVVRELNRPLRWGPDPAMPEWTGPADVTRLGLALFGLAAPLLAWSPWVAVLAGQMHTLATGYWIPPLTLGQFIYPFFALLWGFGLPARLNEVGAVVVFGLTAFAVVKAVRLRQCRELAWLVVAPAALAALASVVWKPIYLYRGLIGAAVPMALLIGWAVTHETGWLARGWAALVVGTLLALGVAGRGPALAVRAGENTRVMEVVTAGWQEGDVVYHGNVGSLTGFLASGPELPNFLMPVQPGSVGVLTPQTRRAMGFCEGPLAPGVVVTNCGAVPWRRAWLVWGASQTISGVEDQAVAAILAAYPNVKILDIRDVYSGPLPLDGGLWLLTNP